jgi:hypothetical protein
MGNFLNAAVLHKFPVLHDRDAVEGVSHGPLVRMSAGRRLTANGRHGDGDFYVTFAAKRSNCSGALIQLEALGLHSAIGATRAPLQGGRKSCVIS